MKADRGNLEGLEALAFVISGSDASFRLNECLSFLSGRCGGVVPGFLCRSRRRAQ
jgi:hypothetical protein